MQHIIENHNTHSMNSDYPFSDNCNKVIMAISLKAIQTIKEIQDFLQILYSHLINISPQFQPIEQIKNEQIIAIANKEIAQSYIREQKKCINKQAIKMTKRNDKIKNIMTVTDRLQEEIKNKERYIYNTKKETKTEMKKLNELIAKTKQENNQLKQLNDQKSNENDNDSNLRYPFNYSNLAHGQNTNKRSKHFGTQRRQNMRPRGYQYSCNIRSNRPQRNNTYNNNQNDWQHHSFNAQNTNNYQTNRQKSTKTTPHPKASRSS